jgi:hypothetical protein
MQLSWGKVVSRLFKLIDEGRIVISKPVNEDVNDTSENVDNEPEIVNDVDEDADCSKCLLNGNKEAGILECHPENGDHKCFSGPEGPDEMDPVENEHLHPPGRP